MSCPVSPEPSVTAILLSWRRHATLERIATAVSGWARIGEVMVWNNDPETRLDLPGITVIHAGRNFGSIARYAPVLLARHDTIWFQDDDLLLEEAQFEAVHAAYAADRSRLYGCQGRNLTDGRYSPKPVYGACDIIVGQTMLFHRPLLRHLAACLDRVEMPPCADDITFSLACPTRHWAVNVEPVTEIGWDDDNALWRRPDHFAERQTQSERMLAWRRSLTAAADAPG